MNLFGFGEIPLPLQIVALIAVTAAVTAFLFYTLTKSKRLADFLDAIADERIPARQKLGTLADVWRRKRKVVRVE